MLTYRELFEEIGRHLSVRREAIIWRSIFLTSPVLGFFALYFFSDLYVPWLESLPKEVASFIALTILGILAAIAGFIHFVFEVEKRIWIDSYFDGEPLTLRESWRIAHRLFVPAMIFRLKIFFYYYAIPLLSLPVILVLWFASKDIAVLSLGIPFIVLLTSIFGYCLKVRLRYAWFYFLDSYGSRDSLSIKTVTGEIDRMNEVMKGEAFRKSLLATFGTDTVRTVADIAVTSMQKGLSSLGGSAGVMGTVVGVVGREISRQITDYGNIAAQYALYRIVKRELTGQEQQVNNNIYLLRD